MLGFVASALRIIHGRGTSYYVLWLLGLSSVLFGFLAHSTGSDSAYIIGAGLRVLFMSYLIVSIFSDILRRRNVTFDAVLGAGCVYVLLGLAFGSAYTLLELLVPGSFSFPHLPETFDAVHDNSLIETSLVYFSLVTMTTLGFGDIVPSAPPARSMTVLESMIGQLYLTIIIARLVGMEIAKNLQKSDSHDDS